MKPQTLAAILFSSFLLGCVSKETRWVGNGASTSFASDEFHCRQYVEEQKAREIAKQPYKCSGRANQSVYFDNAYDVEVNCKKSGNSGGSPLGAFLVGLTEGINEKKWFAECMESKGWSKETKSLANNDSFHSVIGLPNNPATANPIYQNNNPAIDSRFKKYVGYELKINTEEWNNLSRGSRDFLDKNNTVHVSYTYPKGEIQSKLIPKTDLDSAENSDPLESAKCETAKLDGEAYREAESKGTIEAFNDYLIKCRPALHEVEAKRHLQFLNGGTIDWGLWDKK